MSGDEDAQAEVEELGLSTAKRGVIYLLGEVVTSVVVLFLLIFLARYLQPAEYGLYSIAVAFSGLLGIGSTFGVGVAFRKMLPEIKMENHALINEIISNGYYLASAIGLIVGIAGFLLSGYIATALYGNLSLTLPLQLASAAEFLAVLFNLALAALVGMHKVKEAAISNAAYSVGNLVASVALVLAGYGIVGALSGMLIGLVAGAAFGLLYIGLQNGHRLVKPKKVAMKKLTAFSAPVVASHVATQGAQNFAVLFLGVFASAAIVGNYGAAFKLARFIELSITAITFILLPAFAKALLKENIAQRIGSIYNNSLYYTSLLLFPLIAYMTSTAAPWFRVLVGAQYALAPQYFIFIVVGMAAGLIGIYAGTLIIGQGDVKRFMKYQVIAVVIQVALLFIFTPSLLAIGVIIALFAITPIVLDIIYIKALEDQFKFKHELKQFFIVAIISIILGLLMYGVSSYLGQGRLAIVIDAVLAMLLFPPLLGLTRGITRKNLEFIKNTGKRLSLLKPVINAVAAYTGLFVNN